MSTERRLPERLDPPERWRYACPRGHSQVRSARGGDALYCRNCDRHWELDRVLDKKTGRTVR